VGVATDKLEEIMSRPLSVEEIKRRQRAAQPRSGLIATMDGELTQKGETPEAPKPYRSPEQPID
jgi:hypothetical protein